MDNHFLDFWHLYAPKKEYHNRFIASRKLWESMDRSICEQILEELRREAREQPGIVHEKNPYFYLIDWQPPQPQWLSPKEVGYLLAQHVSLAVCLNPQTGRYGTVTHQEAMKHGLQVHHWM